MLAVGSGPLMSGRDRPARVGDVANQIWGSCQATGGNPLINKGEPLFIQSPCHLQHFMFKGHPTSIHNQVRFCDTGWKRITRYSRHLVANADTMDYQPVGNVVVGGAARNAESRVIISKIEDILENIVDALNENRVLTIPLRNRRSGNERLIRFPANTDAEVKRFSRLILPFMTSLLFSF